MAEITSEDRAAVATETKARIKGIMTHEEAKGREGLAEHLAYNTDNTVEEAVAMLKVSPKAQAEEPAKEEPAKEEPAKEEPAKEEPAKDDKAKGGSAFENAMDQGKHPEVGPDGSKAEGVDGERQQRVAAILGAQSAATGRKFNTDKAA